MKKQKIRLGCLLCQVWGAKAKGTGYTDHCPNYLFSRHVDISPGDRKEGRGGPMKPIGITKRKGKWQIFYRCQKCGYQRANKLAPEDNENVVFRLMAFGQIVNS